MPMTDRVIQVPIQQIQVLRDSRQRRVIQTADLEESIAQIGLLQPIIIDNNFVLHAGERRLTACRNLKHATILCRFVEDLDPIDAQIIELEENIKRQDLPWRDLVEAVAHIHSLFKSKDPGWTQAETASRISLGEGSVSMYLRVHSELDSERLAEAGTIREAYNVLQRRDARAAGDALQELIEDVGGSSSPLPPINPQNQINPDRPSPFILGLVPPTRLPAEQSILLMDFLKWAPTYDGPKFNFIHCDFPYGIDFAAGPQGRGSEGEVYSDTKETFEAILKCFCKNIDKLLSISAHIMFWYSIRNYDLIMDYFDPLLKEKNMDFHIHPLIWLKSDNSGISPDPRRHPRHIYETCLFLSRGKRQLVRITADAYSCATDKHLHTSTKPEPMLRHFMRMLVDEHTIMLDPTCGSGASIRAAESLGAKHVLGLEIDPVSWDAARTALHQFRRIRLAEEALKAKGQGQVAQSEELDQVL